MLHQALVMLFRDRPRFAPELLSLALHLDLGEFAEARLESVELGDVVPTEYWADLVVALYDDRGDANLTIALEAQLRVDERKRFTWPVYLATLRARYQCSALVFVMAVDEEVAEWCTAPIDMGPSGSLRVFVLGPEAVPLITEPSDAAAAPELAVLSAIAHAKDAPNVAAAAAFAAISAVRSLDDARARFYADLIDSRLNDAARVALEEHMEKYEYQGPFAKKYYGQGRQEGREEGVALGREEGVALGREEGVALGRAEAVLVVLAARNVSMTDAQRARILACRDLAALDRWLLRAATATSIDDVLESA